MLFPSDASISPVGFAEGIGPPELDYYGGASMWGDHFVGKNNRNRDRYRNRKNMAYRIDPDFDSDFGPDGKNSQ